MRPFLNFYGSKWRLARKLGPPRRDIVVEPFAGSAGYSVYWSVPRAILVEIDPKIAGVWKYLIHASEKEIMAIPVDIDCVDDLHHVCEEAKHLVGFWLNRGQTHPVKRRSQWAKSAEWKHQFWGHKIRRRIASQLHRIRDWKIIEGDYTKAPNVEAHWHVDPPYLKAGHAYDYHDLDRRRLAQWIRRRRGFVHVCEGDDADWLDFRPFSITGNHREARFAAESLFEMER